MTKLHLLGARRVRRSLTFPVLAFTVLNTATNLSELGEQWMWMVPAYVLFDGALWTGVAFLVFAVIEWRQTRRPQPRLAAMAAATAGIASLAATIITVRALFESIVWQRPFVPVWLAYLPRPFYTATFYVAIVTGIGYAVYSWAVDDRRRVEEAELDAAVARAELKAATGRLQPELLDVALARLCTLMDTNASAAQRLIADLGLLLHHSLAHSRSDLVLLGEELDHVEHYVDFHRAVGAKSVHVSIGADAEARSRRIPHFAVLAVVQNAIAQPAHGALELFIGAGAADAVVTVQCGEQRVEVELPAMQ